MPMLRLAIAPKTSPTPVAIAIPPTIPIQGL